MKIMQSLFFFDLCKEEKITINNPVRDLLSSNCAIKLNPQENIKPLKPAINKLSNHMDGVVSAAIAEHFFIQEENNIQKAVSKACTNLGKECDEIIFEYMQKKGLSLKDLQENMIMYEFPCGFDGRVTEIQKCCYKGDIVFSVFQKIDSTPYSVSSKMVIKKGNW